MHYAKFISEDEEIHIKKIELKTGYDPKNLINLIALLETKRDNGNMFLVKILKEEK